LISLLSGHKYKINPPHIEKKKLKRPCVRLSAFFNFRDEKVLLAFGKNLKRLRKKQNFTQEELAYSSDISLSQIARIETGKINPTVCTLIIIAKTLKIKPIELMDF
jgi:DNA-binding XRE family transcriptional regulator